MKSVLATVILLWTSARISTAQTSSSPAGTSNAFAYALRLANAGETATARALVDSLMKITTADAPELDELLFLRASLAPSVLDATFDYEKIIADPASERRRESLLRVAQRAMIAGAPAKALEYLRTISRDYPDDSSLATALYWQSAALLDARDVSAACDANREARSHAQSSSSAMLADIDAQAFASCARVTPSLVARTDTVAKHVSPAVGNLKPALVAGAKRYAIQVAAFGRRSDAEEMAARLTKGGLDTHVDGVARPFRVRVGHYATLAEAATELRKLKERKMAGFVTELEQ